MKKSIAEPCNATGRMPTDKNDDHLEVVIAPASGATGESTARAMRRRGILKSLGGGGLLAAGGLVPARWARPVVESVILPAHAQTSSEDASQEPDAPEDPCESRDSLANCDTTLTVNDLGPIGCGSTASAITEFIVDDTGDCPIITNDIDDPGSGNVVEVILISGGGQAVQVLAEVRIDGITNSSVEGFCDQSATTPGPTAQFASYNGCPWLIAFALVIAGSTATITDIEVFPA